MLTGDLLLFTRRRGRVIPRLLEPSQAALSDAAASLLGVVEAHRGRTRGELEQALKEALPSAVQPSAVQPSAVQPKVTAGLAKLLLDRCQFEVEVAADPEALRRDLFDASAAQWCADPVSTAPAPAMPANREQVVETVGSVHGLSPAQVERALFADLAENQVLQSFRSLSAEDLIYRFNVAQVQGLLLRAERLVLTAPRQPDARRLRQLFRYLKFFGLLFQVEAGKEGEWKLVLDGPLSLLESGSRYGMNLAQFFPALLNWKEPWLLRVELVPRRGKPPAQLELQPHPLLRSHYPDQGQWIPEELQKFLERFNSLGSSWRARHCAEVLTLPYNKWLIPDLEFERISASAGGEAGKEGEGSDGAEAMENSDAGAADSADIADPARRVFLEYLPYPVRERAEQRLQLIRTDRPRDYLLACRGTPAIQPLAPAYPQLVCFRRTLLPKLILERLEA